MIRRPSVRRLSSVRPFVRPSVRPSMGPLVLLKLCFSLKLAPLLTGVSLVPSFSSSMSLKVGIDGKDLIANFTLELLLDPIVTAPVASQVTRRPEYYTTALEWSSFRMHNVFMLFDALAAGKCFSACLAQNAIFA